MFSFLAPPLPPSPPLPLSYRVSDVVHCVLCLSSLARSSLISLDTQTPSVARSPRLSLHPSHHAQIGELFPGPSKTTRAYLHTEEAVRQALAEKGFTIKRTEMTSTNFYYSRMLEAVRE